MNPDISVIVDGTAGYGNRASYSTAGDDPVLKGGSSDRPAGFTLQELEVAFQAVVDPFFRADVFLTIPNLEKLEVEEAVITYRNLEQGELAVLPNHEHVITRAAVEATIDFLEAHA